MNRRGFLKRVGLTGATAIVATASSAELLKAPVALPQPEPDPQPIEYDTFSIVSTQGDDFGQVIDSITVPRT